MRLVLTNIFKNENLKSKKVGLTFLLSFLSLIGFAQKNNICQILNKTIEKYKCNVFAFHVTYDFSTSTEKDISKYEGDLYYNNTQIQKPPHYVLQCDEKYVYFNNSKYYGYNNIDSNQFTDLSSFDSTRLLKGKIINNLIPNFLMYKPFLKDYIDGCKSNIVKMIEINDSYEISIEDHQIGGLTMKGMVIGKTKGSFYSIEIDKKTYLITKHKFEIITEIGGIEEKQLEVHQFIQIPKSTFEINTRIENQRPFKNLSLFQKAKDSETYSIGSFFPKFNLKELNNLDFSDSLIKSRYVLVEFWYKSCAPCIINMQQLKKIDSMFSRDDLTILAINDIDTNAQLLTKLAQKLNLNYTLLFRGNLLAQKLQINEHPQTFIYDTKDRKIVYKSKGGGPLYSLNIKEVFDKILKQESNSTKIIYILISVFVLILIFVFMKIIFGTKTL